MRSSCIEHRPQERMLLLREDYLAICDGNHAAASLLSVFEYWHNVKLREAEQESVKAQADPDYVPDESLWVYKSHEQLAEDMMYLYGRRKIGESIRQLIERGFLRTRNNPRNWSDRTKQYLFNVETVQNALNNLGDSDCAKRNVPLCEKEQCQSAKRNDHTEITSETTMQREKRVSHSDIYINTKQGEVKTEHPGMRSSQALSWNSSEQERLSKTLRMVSQSQFGSVTPALIQRLHDASNGVPVDEVINLLVGRYSEGHRPDYDNGPRSWTWYVRTVENHFRKSTRETPQNVQGANQYPDYQPKPPEPVSARKQRMEPVTADALAAIIGR